MTAYKPSNGTEGDIFCAHFCDRCIQDIDDNCPILTATLIYDIGDAKYPPEWQYDEVPGKLPMETAKCTAFIAIGDDAELAAAKNDPRQGSLGL